MSLRPLADALVSATVSTPALTFVIGAVVAATIVLTPRWREHRSTAARTTPGGAAAVAKRYTAEHRTVGVAALTVLGVSIAVEVLARLVLDLQDQVSWWRYAAPVATAAVELLVLALVIVTHGSHRAQEPVLSGARRSWLSFGPLVGLVGAGAALLVLVATTVAAGAASSRIGDGPFVYLELPAPNTDVDPLRVWFFGWAYGVAVLLCTALLLCAAVTALAVNARRPFLRSDTVAAEHHERRTIATGVTSVATAGALLTLAGAWRFIADAGRPGSLTIEGRGTFEIPWRYADLAVAAGWLAPVAEIVAVALLLLAATQLRPALRRRPDGHPVTPAAAVSS